MGVLCCSRKEPFRAANIDGLGGLSCEPTLLRGFRRCRARQNRRTVEETIMSVRIGRTMTATRLNPERDWLLTETPELAGLIIGRTVEVYDVSAAVKTIMVDILSVGLDVG